MILVLVAGQKSPTQQNIASSTFLRCWEFKSHSHYTNRCGSHLEPLQVSDFNGDVESGGYKIEFREVTDFPSPLSSFPSQVELKGVSISEVVLNELIRDKNYEITVIPSSGTGETYKTRSCLCRWSCSHGGSQEIWKQRPYPNWNKVKLDATWGWSTKRRFTRIQNNLPIWDFRKIKQKDLKSFSLHTTHTLWYSWICTQTTP